MSSLEERLRTAINETGAEVPPDHSPPLRLPRQARRPSGTLRRGGPQHWPAWLAPLATAVAVIAVIAGTLVASHLVFGGTSQPAAGHPPQPYARPPLYYAGFNPDGGFGIRATATGKLVMALRSNAVATATPNGLTFVFGSWAPPHRAAPGAGASGLRTPAESLRFELVHVTPGGTTHASRLSLTERLTPNQMPSIALSPDGHRLAMAYGPGRAQRTAVVQVITLATGKVRHWAWPRADWTPFLNGVGAWSADGRTLTVKQHVWSTRLLTAPHIFLLDTVAPGGVRPSRHVVLHVPDGYRLEGMTLPMLTPNGAELIAPIETGALPNQWRGGIAVFSASTGALTDIRGRWVASGHDVRAWNTLQVLAWSNWSGSKLIELQPRGSTQVLGELSGGVFTQAGPLLPRQAGYQNLRRAVIADSGVIW